MENNKEQENNKQEQPFTLLPDALRADMKSAYVTGSIMELFTNGEMSEEAFVKLYGASRDADIAVRKVVELATWLYQQASEPQEGEQT